MSRLFIVRHGNTFEAGEVPRRIGARTDLPLTATGMAQGEALGRHFLAAGTVFSRAFSGPLLRTRTTAAAIVALQTRAPAIELRDFLTEIDHGPDENQPEPAVEARMGRAALELWDRDAIAPDGWSTQTVARIAAWHALPAQLGADDDVLMVTSNGAARFALIAFGLAAGPLKLRTGAYGIIEVGSDGVFRLVEWDKRPD